MDYTRKTISLGSSRLSHAFDENESFWEDEINRVQKLIQDHMKSIADRKTRELQGEDGQFSNLLTIALFGTYGSGKSSLLRTLVKTINKSRDNQQFSLNVVDPSLLDEDKGSFLYAFLAEALERERERLDHRENEATLSPLLRIVQDLSEYLQAVDMDVKHSEDDPIGTSLAHLERHSSALRLREKMNQFLDILANTLTGHDRGVIILPVDDADMGAKTLVSTLLLFRRYLQHPRLIPIFTFTGRVAEELLCSHFEEKLQLKGAKNSDENQWEVSTKITIAENLAQQYLGKIFPVRNRIKLGMAAARAQQARYVETTLKTPNGEKDHEERSVFDLLCYSSMLLFGHTQNQIRPEIRVPLRSSTLRRQIQIIDALHASKINEIITAQHESIAGIDPTNIILEGSFAEVYETSTWSLLNVHRDVLKELKLHLEDLYSWTSQGLQQAITISILKLELKNRRDILNHWRIGTEERRSLTLSLLAANVFRPRMYPEEPTGDNPSQIFKLIKQRGLPDGPENDPKLDLDYRLSFSCRKGLLWFLNLWHGFYLPQILARNRASKQGHSPEEPVIGIGWNMRGAAVNAIREALINNQVTSTGMLFLDAENFAGMARVLIENENALIGNQNHWESLMLDIWCHYGTDLGKPWAAISLWRGLTLVGQILQTAVDLLPEAGVKRNEKNKDLFENRIKNVLYEHLRAAHVIGRPPKEQANPPKPTEKEDYQNWGQWKHAQLSTLVDRLAESTYQWVIKYTKDQLRIHPLAGIKPRNLDKKDADEVRQERDIWKACFTRRMHGENLIGKFWHSLQDMSPGELFISTEMEGQNTLSGTTTEKVSHSRPKQ